MKILCLMILLVCLTGSAHAEVVANIAESARHVEMSPDRKAVAFWDGAEVGVCRLAPPKQRYHWVPQGTPAWIRFSSDRSLLIIGLEEKRIEGWTVQGR